MNLEKRFKDVAQFLSTHQPLHELEALLRYPELPKPYRKWISPLQYLNTDELIDLENLELKKLNLHPDHYDFCQKVQELQKLPLAEYQPKDIPKALLVKMTEKKRHEISLIQSQLEKDQEFIDIGSGAGHLSGVLLFDNDKKSLCIDKDEKIQSIGKDKFQDIKERLRFETREFNDNLNLKTSEKQTLVGLHCCGDLSADLLSFFKSNNLKNVLNYACCYHKITKYPLSKIGKDLNLKFSNHALTMAAKSYKTMSKKEYKAREKVKRYRYTLHFIMLDYLNLPFKTLGNGTKEDYEKSFSDYCYKYLPEARTLAKQKLEDLFDSYSNSYREILLYGIIRSHLSRLIEVYINIDRALFLKEAGYEVHLEEVFDRKISPRNIALRAHAKEA